MAHHRGLVLLLILILLTGATGCTTMGTPKTALKVLAAGSLLSPFGELEREFEQSHPGVDVQVEGHGSIQVIRQVTDLGRSADVVAVADASLIPDLMYVSRKDGSRNYTDWYLPFAGNAMVLAYTNQSRYAGEITRDNWAAILQRPGVRTGISNPMLDAAGYRALMVILLEEQRSGTAGLFSGVIGNRTDPPLTVEVTPDHLRVVLPEVLKPGTPAFVVRDGSIYLLSLLDTGGIDYAFEYRSVAQDHGLRWIDLGPEVDLSDPAEAGKYRAAEVELGFRRFSAIGTHRVGQPIVYAITIPSGAEQPALAREFVDLVCTRFGEGREGWPSPLPAGGAA
jgi:molybdate/tungstate transport system substrate-binding protein